MDNRVQVPESHWWLLDGPGGANFTQAWALAKGGGLVVGMIDDPVNAGHVDLFAAITAGQSGAGTDPGLLDGGATDHGTHVAGLIAGLGGNQAGGIGAAPDAQIVASILRLQAPLNPAELAGLLTAQKAVDVSNNSWGVPGAFADSFGQAGYRPVAAALTDVVTNGRDGLGTNVVFAAGNGKLMLDGVNHGDDVNFHSLANSRMTIAVGATDATGRAAFFSTPGTAVLLSAPGQGLITADGQGAGASGVATVSGTSFAAPLVSSAIALMLQVNPRLGYRDVQDILAISARPSDGGGAQINGAGHVNGGGLVFDRTLGFGRLDAEAAVRLARHWTAQSTAANEQHLSADFGGSTALPTGQTVLTLSMAAGPAITLDWVELTLNLTDSDLRNLRIELISPDGTRSVVTENMTAAGGQTVLNHRFSTAAHRGEDVTGTWQLELSHPAGNAGLVLASARLDFYGDFDGADDSQYITRAFGRLAQADPARAILIDTDGGHDVLNFAASGGAVQVNLQTGGGMAQGQVLQIGGFEAVIGGARADRITGDTGANVLTGDGGGDQVRGGAGNDRIHGNEGRDRLFGGAGDDSLDGGAGRDVLRGGPGADTFVFRPGSGAGTDDRIVDFTPGQDHILIIPTGRPGEVLYEAASGFLWFDPTGDNTGPALLIARLAPGLDLGAPGDWLR